MELVGVAGDTVRIRLEGHCQGCPSSMVTLKLAVEKAIYEAAPDVAAIEVLDPPDASVSGPPAIAGLVSLPVFSSSGPRPAPRPSVSPSGEWVTLAARAAHIDNGSVLKTRADNDAVLIARAGDVFYAYVATCPACEGGMEAAALDGAQLVCDLCGARYDIRRAGAGIESDLRIEPLPLLEELASPADRDPRAAGMSTSARLTGLRGLIRERVPAERCELCSAELSPHPHHEHLFEPSSRQIHCSCTPCAILFPQTPRNATVACHDAFCTWTTSR